MPEAPKIYILHSPKDNKFLKPLEGMLITLKDQGIIKSYWSVENLIAGSVVDNEIQSNLNNASILIALVSSDYLISNECQSVQKKAQLAGKTIIPVIVRSCLWDLDPILKGLRPQPLYKGELLEVDNWTNKDNAFLEVAKQIIQVATAAGLDNPAEKAINTVPQNNINGIHRTILFMGANPPDSNRLRLDEEIREIDERLRLSKKRDLFQLEQKWAVRSKDILQHFQDQKPNIVHFSGHGAGEPGLVFEDNSGKKSLVQADALEELFNLYKNTVECVILNACYSAWQAEAISKQIPFVVGMKNKVPDSAAIAFASGFYIALGGGESYKTAFESGKVQMKLSGEKSDWVPVLFEKS